MWTIAVLKKRADADAFLCGGVVGLKWDTVEVDDEHVLVLVEARMTAAEAAVLVEHSSAVPGLYSRLVWYESYLATEIREQYAVALKRVQERGEAEAAMRSLLDDALRSAQKVTH